MKVLLISYAYDPNDVSESYTAYCISREIKKKHDVLVFTRDSIHDDSIKNIKVKWFPSKYPYDRALKIDYYEFIIRCYFLAKNFLSEIDIIHHISPISFRFPNPLCNLNKPFVWGPVGGSIPYPKGFRHVSKNDSFIVRLRAIDNLRFQIDPFIVNTLKKASKIVVNCSQALDILPEQYRKKAEAIPEGIDIQEYNLEPNTNKGNFIFSSGRLHPYKAHDLLIKAYAQLRTTNPPKLLITGEGPEKKKLSRLINELGLNRKVVLMGRVSKRMNLSLMRNSLFCVFPALNEAFGHVNLEAMAQMKPVIVTDFGGPSDIVENGISGFKIFPNNQNFYINELSSKMSILLTDNLLRKEMGRRAYNKVVQEFSWTEIGKRYINLYNSIS